MDLFGRKKKEAARLAHEQHMNDQMKILSDFRDVGEVFRHVGITMIVNIIEYNGWSEHAIAYCDYSDRDGKVCQYRFYEVDLPMLRAENP